MRSRDMFMTLKLVTKAIRTELRMFMIELGKTSRQARSFKKSELSSESEFFVYNDVVHVEIDCDFEIN